MEAPLSWLIFAYQVPASPSTHRAYVWRKLKAIGALYLQNSFCILPDLPQLQEFLKQLRDEIENRGGSSTILHVSILKEEECATLIERFQQQMEDEYGEFIEQCEVFHKELAMERDRKHFTFGELEENDANIAKLRIWLPKLRARDFFHVPKATHAVEELEACEEDFRTFEAEVEAESKG
jgi:uncharacterized protein Usg